MTKRILALWSLVIVALGSIVVLALPVHADPPATPARTFEPPVPTPTEIAAAAVTPEHIEQIVQDPWFAPLRELVEKLSDAYVDKPHTYRGLPAGEPAVGRELRLDAYTRDTLHAVRDRAGELAQFGPDAAWKYVVTMAWIAHRETRIASNPAKLGDQDEGRAHGYWQVWEWHGMDPFAASTALDMLITEPSSSWSLPKGHPWTGYPECARWIATHPAPPLD